MSSFIAFRRFASLPLSALALAAVHCGGDDAASPPADDSGAVDSTTPGDSSDSAAADSSTDASVDGAVDSAVPDGADAAGDVATDTTPPPPGTWRQTGGPAGGWIRAFAFNSKGDAYLVSDEAYVFKRPKVGTWHIASTGLSFIDSGGHFDNVLRSGPADEIYMFPGRPENALSKSSDDGATWSHKWDYTMLPGKSGGLGSVAVSQSGYVFVGSSGGTGYALRRSKDGGATWVNYASIGLNRVSASGKIVFAYGDTDAVQRSSDEGDTFTASVSGLPAGAHVGPFTAIVGGVAYVLMENATTGAKSVWKSSDSGATWATTAITVPASGHHLVIDPSVTAGTRVFLAGDADLVVSSDGGTSSTASKPFGKYFGTDLEASGFDVSPTGEVFVGTRGAGVTRSTDHGVTFVAYDETLAATNVTGVIARNDVGATGANGDLYTWGTNSVVSRSTDDGKTWTPTAGYISFSAPNDVAVSPKGTLFVYDQRSIDNGVTFTPSAPAGAGTIGAHFFARSGDLLLLTSTGLHRSTDEGVTWGTADATMAGTSNLLRGKSILVVQKGFGVMKSTDDGKTWAAWTPDFSGAVTGAPQVKPALALPDGTLLFVLDTFPAPSLKKISTLARSTDDGVTWTAVGTFPAGWTRTSMSTDAPGNAYLALKVPEVTAATTGETHSVFQSTDKGATWKDISPTTINIPMLGMANNKAGALFAATPGAGIWTR